jgi:hypothetical protein
MIGVDLTRDDLDALEAKARASGNTLALEALEMVQTVLMARHSLMMHIEKERGLRLQYHAALTRAKHWARPEGRRKVGKRTLTKEDLCGVVENMLVEVLTGLGEVEDGVAV